MDAWMHVASTGSKCKAAIGTRAVTPHQMRTRGALTSPRPLHQPVRQWAKHWKEHKLEKASTAGLTAHEPILLHCQHMHAPSCARCTPEGAPQSESAGRLAGTRHYAACPCMHVGTQARRR